MTIRTNRAQPAPKPPELLSATEAGRRLNVSSQTIRNWYYAGRLKGLKIGVQVMLYSYSVDALLVPQDPIPKKGI